MLSVPAATPIAASPNEISCATLTTDWKPEPHSRLMLSAGVPSGTSHLSAVCRARYAASGEVCCTLPTHTVSTAEAGVLEDESAAFVARYESSVAEKFLSLPPNAPNGVRLAPTMKRRVMTVNL